MDLGATFTDNKSLIGRIVSFGDSDLTADVYTVLPNKLSHDILHYSYDNMSKFVLIKKSNYLKVEGIFMNTKTQVMNTFNNAEHLPVEFAVGKSICTAAKTAPIFTLKLIHKIRPLVLDVDMVVLYENSVTLDEYCLDEAYMLGAEEYGIESIVVEKIIKMIRLSIAAIKSYL